ncbi:MAG: hypothetical protein NTV04_10265, partial [Deltaproteobacteria bacterium]|nr:hypothetical protein [Deltaproteobacteria bacterium]
MRLALFLDPLNPDDLVKSPPNDGFDCRGVRRTPMSGRAPLAPTCRARKNRGVKRTYTYAA